ncbi:MAG: carboxypeptidase [Bacteroidetes bacterium]|jgi:carboxypeptidase Taq|nr:carboxypeptidase [Bacteroidota bacterium]
MSYSKFESHMKKIADVGFAMAVLSWDQETYMPEKGADFRAQQLSTLSGVYHKLFTEDELGKLLSDLSADASLNEQQKKNISLTLESYQKQKKFTTEFVELMSKTVSECFQAWQSAKEKNDFSVYQPKLEKLVELKKQECELLGYEGHPYNAQLNEYEKGTTTADIEKLFEEVRKELVPFVKKIKEAQQVDDALFYRDYPKDKQWDFGIELLKQMGFDFTSGRQDISSHPFTTSFNPYDVRVTTRVNEKDLSEMIWSCIHEGGHGLYEQGLPAGQYGLPCGEAVSLGIHESQSRLWENNVGRSMAYWKKNFNLAKKYFPEQLQQDTAEGFYKAMNKVEPSLIRTSADELTYHFHIMIRFEIEKALFENKLKVSDLPAYWNAKYKEYLGIDVPTDTKGVLQDIHWSHGSFGYFPTYSIGSFYAAQFFDQAKKEIPGLVQQIENGDLHSLLNWLRERIHRHGRFYTASELCEKITGEKLNFSHFMNYAREKYSAIYGLK